MIKNAEINVSDIDFMVAHPADLGTDVWLKIQKLHYACYGPDIEAAVGEDAAREFSKVDHPYTFRRSRSDPTASPELQDGNTYARPLAALAFTRDKYVGYAYSADNSSGKYKSIKMAVPPVLPVPLFGGKRYHWVREMVVAPEHRGKGISRVLGGLLLSKRSASQTTVTYTYPDILQREQELLLEAGFTITGEMPVVPPFGRDTSQPAVENERHELVHPFFRVRQNRLVAPTGQLLKDLYEASPELPAIVKNAQRG